MFKKMQNHKGFTLIEMMAVIAIVAVLVAIVVPIVGKAQMKSKGAVDAANLRSLSATVSTRYVSSEDPLVLKEGLENPGSEVRPGYPMSFYVDGNAIVAMYDSSALASAYFNLLDEVDVTGYGINYSTDVATNGDADTATRDTVNGGKYLFTLGANFDDPEYQKLIADELLNYSGAVGEMIDNKYSEDVQNAGTAAKNEFKNSWAGRLDFTGLGAETAYWAGVGDYIVDNREDIVDDIKASLVSQMTGIPQDEVSKEFADSVISTEQIGQVIKNAANQSDGFLSNILGTISGWFS